MLSTTPAFFALVLIGTFFLAPVKAQCDSILERREWRTLNDTEKASYINAVKCLQAHPALDPPFEGPVSRFDEFQAYHVKIADDVHAVGEFLPWHRLYLKNYENALRSECGYIGAGPYWDWTQDADATGTISKSPIFDPVTGFGGDGVPGTYTLPPFGNDSRITPEVFRGCVQDGPFANYTLNVGPGKLITQHCLVRGFQDSFSKYLTTAAVTNTTNLLTFDDFRKEVEGHPFTDDFRMHDGGHVAVGGEMSNFFSSPGDPLFFLHHANIDRIWWQWQQKDAARLYEIAGPATLVEPVHNVTLDYALVMGSLGPTLPIRDIMDISSKPSCYAYI
ncbi:hypothetical protein GALMADRAFT_1169475 [Galerina marginata CBS 339.88]|uniref:Tyrosinase copper-binding domain-containing protein n=1 Tax=Galerina marginata (strain CBS 339.88) TaxID=685588 RepID=A0A067T9P6_GALM3|nr:hypothetical protein GALMADRAFT_1169475 [Galerina marginata CBS 339.88]